MPPRISHERRRPTDTTHQTFDSTHAENLNHSAVVAVAQSIFNQQLTPREPAKDLGSKKINDSSLLNCIRINKSLTSAPDGLALAKICRESIDQFNAVNFSTALYRLAKLSKERRFESNQTILDLLIDRLPFFIKDCKSNDLSSTAWAFATLGIRDNPSMQAIAAEVTEKIRQFNPQNLANTAWAFATLGIRDDPLMHAIAREALVKIGQFTPQGLANTAWAFATLNIRDDPLMYSIATEAMVKTPQFRPQGLANTAWAFATLGIRDDSLMHAIATEVTDKIRQFNPQDLANTAWAFATLGIRDPSMHAIATEVTEKIRQFNPQNLSNTAWAFATLGIHHDPSMYAIATEVTDKIRQFNPQNLSNTAWAFATLGIRDDHLMRAIAREALVKIDQFTPQNLANTAWAFATLDIRDDHLMRAIAREVLVKIGQFTSQDLANIVWAFATLGIRHDPLMDAIAREALVKIGQFTPQGLANTAWAFATLDIRHDPLMHSIAREVFVKTPQFTSQILTNIAWAFAISNFFNLQMLEAIKQAIEKQSLCDFSNKSINQLQQVQAWLDLIQKPISLIPRDFPPATRSVACRSILQQQVGRHLSDYAREYGLRLQEEAYLPQIDHNVDFILYNDSETSVIVIEVDGPSHFTTTNEALGHTLFRNHQIQRLGYTLSCLPYWDWEALKSDQAREAYIERTLASFFHARRDLKRSIESSEPFQKRVH